MRFPSLLHPDKKTHGREAVENGAALAADLNLVYIFSTMAGGDRFIRKVAEETLLNRERLPIETIRYRQEILHEFLCNPSVCLGLYKALSEGVDRYHAYQIKSMPSFSTFITASAVVKDRITFFRILFDCNRKVRDIMKMQVDRFVSPGLCACFNSFLDFFSEDFLKDSVETLDDIETVCESMYVGISAGLGSGLKGDRYVLQSIADDKAKRNGVSHYQSRGREIELASIGIQAQAGKLRDAALSQISYVLKQVNEAMLADIESLRYSIAFYLGGVNLCQKLEKLGMPICFPDPKASGDWSFEFDCLMDIGLGIKNLRCPVGNTFKLDPCRLLVVTGANQGGKSTFIRSIGCAQLMMQCGLFVAAKAYRADLCSRIFTHFCRAESERQDQGRLNEELSRMGEIAGRIERESLVLMNESFSTTQEREASSIAHEILQAFYDSGIKIIYVTHFYEFARTMEEKHLEGVHFLVAQRNADGTRPYTLSLSSPEHTSFGLDIYREVFGETLHSEPGGMEDRAARY